MGIRFTRNRVEYEDSSIILTRWVDDDLENDEIDLDEWAFWKGYNDEENNIF